MKPRTWVIIGASSIIAEEFAHLAAASGHSLRLVGRDLNQLTIVASDIKLRYQISCELVIIDMAEANEQLLTALAPADHELDLFIAHSDFTDNAHLSVAAITKLIQVNILATTLLIHHYLNTNQTEHNLLYLSSVAACRGRAKNSLYGASKAAIEVYLQGLQQEATAHQHLCIAKLGFIDTRQTWGLPGIFYAAPPRACAKACWRAINKKKRQFYYPRFWHAIMAIITRLPFIIYKRIK